jgi:hypothetical protein
MADVLELRSVTRLEDDVVTAAGIVIQNELGEAMNVKKLLFAALMTHKGSPLEALTLVELAEKLRSNEGEMPISSGEAVFLEKILEENTLQWGSIILGQLYRAVKGL